MSSSLPSTDSIITAGINDSNGNASHDAQFACDGAVYIFLIVSMYPLAFVVIAILAILSCTGRCYRGKVCQAHCIYPINMFDGYQDRLGYACIFGAMTVQLIDVLLKGNTLSGALAIMDVSKDIYIPPYPLVSPFIRVLTLLFNVGLIATAFYPLFICLAGDYRFLGACLGLVCTLYRLAVGFWIVIECQEKSQDVAKRPMEQYNTLIYNMPSLICLAGLAGKFSNEAIKCIRERRLGLYVRTQPLAELHHVLHVRRLLGPTPLPWHEEILDNAGIVKRIRATFTYKSLPYFRFPTRLIATFVILVTATYQIGLMVIFKVWSLIKDLEDATKSIELLGAFVGITIASLAESYLGKIERWLRVASNIWIGITGITALLAVMYIYRACICYRKHIYRLYKGDRSMFPRKWSRMASQNIMTNAVRYAGLQVAFFMWGFVVIQIVLFLLAFFITYVLIIPALEFQYYKILIFVAEILIIPMVLGILIYQSQVLLTKFLFLQPKLKKEDAKVPLAVNNRHAYYNVSFFYFFFNILLGFMTAIMRVLKGMVLGLFLIPRIDHSVIMPGFVSMDAGFVSYLSLLTVNAAHDHPVVRVFLKLLRDGATERKARQSEVAPLSKTTRKARRNWQLAYTLLCNPSVIRYRKTTTSLHEVDPSVQHRIEVAARHKDEGASTQELFAILIMHDEKNSSIEMESIEKC